MRLTTIINVTIDNTLCSVAPEQCDVLCGEGKQHRTVLCYITINGIINILDDSDCSDETPENQKTCQSVPCEGVDWVLAEWSGVSNSRREHQMASLTLVSMVERRYYYKL